MHENKMHQKKSAFFRWWLWLQMVTTLVVLVGSSQIQSSLPSCVTFTKYGLVQGTNDGVSRDGRNFFQFRGMQYAVIEERFKSSVEPKSWNNLKPALEFGPSCGDVAEHGNENCLFLNVYTPTLDKHAKLPVVVYIHGGAFRFSNGGNYGPNYLMDEEVILVTINYRMSFLGFMSTGDAASPGNYGLKDQVMALRWVQDNIVNFGGDKDKVTIMGQSAGSASVTYHLVSPMSKGLFHRAIAQSGTFLDAWAFTWKPQRYAKKFAELLDCKDTSNSSAMVDCLKAIPAKTIASHKLASTATRKFYNEPVTTTGPTMEPVMDSYQSNTFLSESPYELLKSGKMNKVPLLTGIVKEEGIYIWAAYLMFGNNTKSEEARQEMQQNFGAVAPKAFYYDEKTPPENLPSISSKIENFYFGKKGFDLSDRNYTFPRLAHLYSDTFYRSAVRFMDLYSKHAPTFPYLYTYNKEVGLEFNEEELHKKYDFDATHAAELDMLFSPLFNRTRSNSDHTKLSKSMIKLWVSFIKDGVPSATFGSARTFPTVQPDKGFDKFYELDVDTKLTNNIFSERNKFWEGLGLSYNDFYKCYC